MSALADHLWQSVLLSAAACGFVALARRNFAALRLWLWRIAALKFVLPFSLLFAYGAWRGYPARYPDDPAPPGAVAFVDFFSAIFAPAQNAARSGVGTGAVFAVSFAATLACGWLIAHGIRRETPRAAAERARRALDADDYEPRPGFAQSALLSAFVMIVAGGTIFAGMVRDRQQHYAVLAENSRALRTATIDMKPAAPGMGTRTRVNADARGVTIRNATLQDLTAIAYGVTTLYVRGQHFKEEGQEDWLVSGRWDIRVTGRVRDPERFDTYALRPLITRLLSERFGLEIYVNARCQPPCGRWKTAMAADGL